jgi:hypothetical protein
VSEITVNGVLDATTCRVTEIAYVAGLLWQFNGTNWYSRTSPTAAWSTGTTVSPLPKTLTIVPAVVEFATTVKRPTLEVDV